MIRCYKCFGVMKLKGAVLECTRCGAVMDPVEDDQNQPNRPQRPLPSFLQFRPIAIAGGLLALAGLVGAGVYFLADGLEPGARNGGDPTTVAQGSMPFAERALPGANRDLERSLGRWTRVVGTAAFDRLMDVGLTSDGGVVLAVKSSGDFIADGSNMALIGMNPDGALAFNIDARAFATARSMALTTLGGGGVVIAGHVDGELVVERLRVGGDRAWRERAPSAIDHPAEVAIARAGDGVVVAGPGLDASTVVVTRLDVGGGVQWTRELPIDADAPLVALAPAFGESVLLAMTDASQAAEPGPSLRMIDADGEVVWRRAIDLAPGARLAGLAPTGRGGGYVAIDSFEPLLLRYSAAGEQAWRVGLPAAASDARLALAASSSGAFVGATYQLTEQAGDIWIGRFDPDGRLTWQDYPRLSGDDRLVAMAVTVTGELVAAGLIREDEFADTDVFVRGAVATAQADAPGRVAIADAAPTTPPPSAARPDPTAPALEDPARAAAQASAEPAPQIADEPADAGEPQDPAALQVGALEAAAPAPTGPAIAVDAAVDDPAAAPPILDAPNASDVTQADAVAPDASEEAGGLTLRPVDDAEAAAETQTPTIADRPVAEAAAPAQPAQEAAPPAAEDARPPEQAQPLDVAAADAPPTEPQAVDVAAVADDIVENTAPGPTAPATDAASQEPSEPASALPQPPPARAASDEPATAFMCTFECISNADPDVSFPLVQTYANQPPQTAADFARAIREDVFTVCAILDGYGDPVAAPDCEPDFSAPAATPAEAPAPPRVDADDPSAAPDGSLAPSGPAPEADEPPTDARPFDLAPVDGAPSQDPPLERAEAGTDDDGAPVGDQAAAAPLGDGVEEAATAAPPPGEPAFSDPADFTSPATLPPSAGPAPFSAPTAILATQFTCSMECVSQANDAIVFPITETYPVQPPTTAEAFSEAIRNDMMAVCLVLDGRVAPNATPVCEADP